MNAIPALTAAALLAGGLVAQQAPSCIFRVGLEPGVVEFHLKSDAPALGAVILSYSPQLNHYFWLLPPILSDHVVFAVASLEEPLVVRVPEGNFAPGIFHYAQGLAANPSGICASEVQDFVLDASVPTGPK